jgi:hypothetical protein
MWIALAVGFLSLVLGGLIGLYAGFWLGFKDCQKEIRAALDSPETRGNRVDSPGQSQATLLAI